MTRPKWIRIDFAPKDGTALILADWTQVCMLSGCPLMGSGYWHAELAEWVGAGGSADVEQPTHFMHLQTPTDDGAMAEAVQA